LPRCQGSSSSSSGRINALFLSASESDKRNIVKYDTIDFDSNYTRFFLQGRSKKKEKKTKEGKKSLSK
jgi:hypothetical protein